MTNTDKLWLNLTASGVSNRGGQTASWSSSNEHRVESRGVSGENGPQDFVGQNDTLQHENIGRSSHMQVKEDVQAEADFSSESWASMPSDLDDCHGHVHDSLSEDTPFNDSMTSPYMPGSIASTPRHSTHKSDRSSTTTLSSSNEILTSTLQNCNQENDPFRPGIAWAEGAKAIAPTSYEEGTESPRVSDITPPIGKYLRMSRKAASKSRPRAVRFSRSVKPVISIPRVVWPTVQDVKSLQAGMRSSRHGDKSTAQHRTEEKGSLSQVGSFPSQSADSKRSSATTITVQIINRTASMIFQIFSFLLSVFLQTVTGPMQSALTIIFLGILVLTFLWYLLRNPLSALTSLSSFSVLPLGLLNGPLQLALPLKHIYCSSIGIGCEGEDPDLGRLAKHIGTQALKAQDMFTSVVSLGDPSALALNHAEIWELAVAVQVSSEMENREDLGKQLADFGHKVRDVKDAMYGLHSKGISAFGWTLRRFARLQKTIQLCHTKPHKYNADKVSRQLVELFEELESSLSDLLSGIERTIPLTHLASEVGTDIRGEFGSEHSRMQKAQDDKPFWRRLKDAGSHAGRQLKRDISMTIASIEAVNKLWFNLEETRSFLLSYRDHVAYFKGGLQGFHVGDHGLDVHEEVHSLQEIMQRFQDAVTDAQRANSPAGPRPTFTGRIAAGHEI